MSANLRPILYAAVLGTVCATLVTVTGLWTEPYRQTNATAEANRSILAVLGVSVEPDASADEVNSAFDQYVRIEDRLTGRRYLYVPTGDRVEATAIPLAGAGLWGPIRGVLAIERDGRTIRAVAFYQQQETPGLGGEIATPQFTERFVGKSIRAQGEAPGVRIVRAAPVAANEIESITGATMTCRRVEAMINEAVAGPEAEVDDE